MSVLDLLTRLMPPARDRDGRARALEPPAAGPPRIGPRHPDDPRQAIEAAVAAKLLGGWLDNRRQTMVPQTLTWAALEQGEAALLIEVMAAAALAGGPVDAVRARRLPQALTRSGAGEAAGWALDRALAEPRPLPALLAEVQEAGLAAEAYAAALLAADRRAPAGRAFLGYLAARLGLSAEVAGRLERRYRA